MAGAVVGQGEKSVFISDDTYVFEFVRLYTYQKD